MFQANAHEATVVYLKENPVDSWNLCYIWTSWYPVDCFSFLLFSRKTVSSYIYDTLLVSSDDLTPAMLDLFKIKAENKTKEQTLIFRHQEVLLIPVCCLHS